MVMGCRELSSVSKLKIGKRGTMYIGPEDSVCDQEKSEYQKDKVLM